MADRQNEKLLNRCKGLIQKCKELDRAMSLSKKNAENLSKAELQELRNLGNKLRRWCRK